MKKISESNIKVINYEPNLNVQKFDGCELIKNFDEFTEMSDVVIANRLDDNMKSIEDKIYIRDLLTRD